MGRKSSKKRKKRRAKESSKTYKKQKMKIMPFVATGIAVLTVIIGIFQLKNIRITNPYYDVRAQTNPRRPAAVNNQKRYSFELLNKALIFRIEGRYLLKEFLGITGSGRAKNILFEMITSLLRDVSYPVKKEGTYLDVLVNNIKNIEFTIPPPYQLKGQRGWFAHDTIGFYVGRNKRILLMEILEMLIHESTHAWDKNHGLYKGFTYAEGRAGAHVINAFRSLLTTNGIPDDKTFRQNLFVVLLQPAYYVITANILLGHKPVTDYKHFLDLKKLKKFNPFDYTVLYPLPIALKNLHSHLSPAHRISHYLEHATNKEFLHKISKTLDKKFQLENLFKENFIPPENKNISITNKDLTETFRKRLRHFGYYPVPKSFTYKKYLYLRKIVAQQIKKIEKLDHKKTRAFVLKKGEAFVKRIISNPGDN